MSNIAVKTGLLVGAVATLAVGREALAVVEPLESFETIEPPQDVEVITALPEEAVINPYLVGSTDFVEQLDSGVGLQEVLMLDETIIDCEAGLHESLMSDQASVDSDAGFLESSMLDQASANHGTVDA